MSSKTTIPPAVQQRIARYQQLQQTLNVLLGERQRLDAELAEINNALGELEKVGEDAKVFKSVGPVLVEAKRENIKNELTERKELNETRLKILEKQESRTRAQLDSLQKELQRVLSQPGSETE
ncbi:MAG: prefoldin subunit beta [Aigarchaeota archaeon]|nr:prefoldin subunit beta [Aigarchaeota archaeon]